MAGQAQHTDFRVRVDRIDGEHARVVFSGEFDLAAASLLRSFCEALTARYRRLDVDLHQVTFVDLSTMRVLLEALGRASARRCAVRVGTAPRAVRRVFALAFAAPAPRPGSAPVP